MKNRVIAALFCLSAWLGCLQADVLQVRTDASHNRNLEFVYRVPEKITQEARVMVLFGGRNWEGQKTLATYSFDDWADENHVLLVSPSFRDDDYWEPAAWSGKALDQAVALLRKKYGLSKHTLLYYGYSAGGQCAALFYAHAPTKVLAWGAHACGVYPLEGVPRKGAPALISCGTKDQPRHQISRNFIFRYRENGGRVLWRDYPIGHELPPDALELAKCFFTAVLKNEAVKYVGDDDSKKVYPASQSDRIDPEYRNELSNDTMLQLWRNNDA